MCQVSWCILHHAINGRSKCTEFKDIWYSLKTPDEIDLPRELEAGMSSISHSGPNITADVICVALLVEGLRTTSSARLAVVTTGQGKKKKRVTNRRMKFTNTHLDIDLSKGKMAFSILIKFFFLLIEGNMKIMSRL